ncbi:MAG: AMP-binding protein, partial [Mycobacterium sp.]|nr:AMP-binding protein [Mycobacterium sp.]
TFGLGALLIFPMRVGAASLLLERATPDVLFSAVAQYKATRLFTTPTAYRRMVDNPRPMPTLKTCISGGEPLSVHTWRAFRESIGIAIVDSIGTTEMLHAFAASAEPDIRPGTVGRAVPGYEVVVLDDESQLASPGEAGRLAVRGPTGCRYLADRRQADYVQKGWNVTGDICVRDADGFIWYQSRSDDIIITGGYSVAPAEVEAAVLQHPFVAECGVVGVTDAIRTMAVKAYVVLKPGVRASNDLNSALRAHCRNMISAHKVPRDIEIVAAIPRTPTGKMRRSVLRRQSGLVEKIAPPDDRR